MIYCISACPFFLIYLQGLYTFLSKLGVAAPMHYKGRSYNKQELEYSMFLRGIHCVPVQNRRAGCCGPQAISLALWILGLKCDSIQGVSILYICSCSTPTLLIQVHQLDIR